MDDQASEPEFGVAHRTEWEGYSDYKTVSKSIVKSIENAINAFAELESRHAEGAKVHPEMAARARMHIKAAALQLVPELRRNADTKEQYQNILERWLGTDELANLDGVDVGAEAAPAASDGGLVDAPRPEDTQQGDTYEHPAGGSSTDDDLEGYIHRLNGIRLHKECPNWLEKFVLDIKAAGFELGYLQAGRNVSVPDGNDPIEEDVAAMFEGLDIS